MSATSIASGDESRHAAELPPEADTRAVREEEARRAVLHLIGVAGSEGRRFGTADIADGIPADYVDGYRDACRRMIQEARRLLGPVEQDRNLQT